MMMTMTTMTSPIKATRVIAMEEAPTMVRELGNDNDNDVDVEKDGGDVLPCRKKGTPISIDRGSAGATM